MANRSVTEAASSLNFIFDGKSDPEETGHMSKEEGSLAGYARN